MAAAKGKRGGRAQEPEPHPVRVGPALRRTAGIFLLGLAGVYGGTLVYGRSSHFQSRVVAGLGATLGADLTVERAILSPRYGVVLDGLSWQVPGRSALHGKVGRMVLRPRPAFFLRPGPSRVRGVEVHDAFAYIQEQTPSLLGDWPQWILHHSGLPRSSLPPTGTGTPSGWLVGGLPVQVDSLFLVFLDEKGGEVARVEDIRIESRHLLRRRPDLLFVRLRFRSARTSAGVRTGATDSEFLRTPNQTMAVPRGSP